jgi:hypothetical protein
MILSILISMILMTIPVRGADDGDISRYQDGTIHLVSESTVDFSQDDGCRTNNLIF